MTYSNRPSVELHALLSGEITPDQCDGAVLSWARLPVYWRAKKIIRLPSRDDRRAALNQVPASIRGMVEDEARRLWEVRHG